MKKKCFILILFFIALLVFSGCSGSSSGGTQAPSENHYFDITKFKNDIEDVLKSSSVTEKTLVMTNYLVGTFLPEDFIAIKDNVTNGVATNAASANKKITLDFTDTGATEIPAETFNKTVITTSNVYLNYLVDIILPDTLEVIGEKAFFNCTGLTEFYIPDSVISIGDAAFGSCSKISYFEVGLDNINYVSDEGNLYNSDMSIIIAYAVGRNDKYYKFPDSVTKVAPYAFSLGTKLLGIEYFANSYIEEIGDYAFNGCSNLTINNSSYDLPGTLTTIGDRAFQSCVKLVSITIPNSVETMGEYILASCTQISTVIFPANSTLDYIPNRTFYNCSSLRNFIIPNTITTINTYAFYGCSSLTDINLNNVTTLGNYSFQNSGLKIITIPYSVISIGTSVFNGCRSLEEVIFSPGFNKSTGSSAFANCTNLTSITIPDSLPTIGSSSFSNCTNLTSINLNKVTSIGNSAFSGCSNLTSVTIPSTIKDSLGTGVFSSCTNLTTVVFQPNTNFKNIKASLFENSGIISIELPSTVTAIQASAFAGCSDLISITVQGTTAIPGSFILPASVNTIGVSAFSYCTSLRNINIPNGIKVISEEIFRGCSNLESVFMPSTITSIETKAFQDCSSLRGITIPDGITVINPSTFLGCTNLTSIELPESVAIITDKAFQDCTALEEVIVNRIMPPTLSGRFWFLRTSSSLIIYVPETSVSIYESTTNWKAYSFDAI